MINLTKCIPTNKIGQDRDVFESSMTTIMTIP